MIGFVCQSCNTRVACFDDIIVTGQNLKLNQHPAPNNFVKFPIKQKTCFLNKKTGHKNKIKIWAPFRQFVQIYIIHLDVAQST